MILPVHHNGRLCYHLGLYKKYEDDHEWELVSNLPKELFQHFDKEIKSLGVRHNRDEKSQEDYLTQVAEIVDMDNRSKSFYYPDYLLYNGKDMFESTFFKFVNLGDGFILHPGKYYSRFHERIRFYILTRKYHIIKHFYNDIFNKEILACSRNDFENSLQSEHSQKEYVDYYAANNHFFKVQETDAELYIMMNENELLMITLI